jgi:sugar phosphate isomerase/epimerase
MKAPLLPQKQLMGDESNGRLQRLKRQAHAPGLALCGFSTHQGFVSLDPAVRQENVGQTLHSIDLAHRVVL